MRQIFCTAIEWLCAMAIAFYIGWLAAQGVH